SPDESLEKEMGGIRGNWTQRVEYGLTPLLSTQPSVRHFYLPKYTMLNSAQSRQRFVMSHLPLRPAPIHDFAMNSE
ncbi:MAG: hypothetical protein ABI444_00790, partial [Candidatus Kapaibacterium sp.]